jgi:hypothetical protein
MRTGSKVELVLITIQELIGILRTQAAGVPDKTGQSPIQAFSDPINAHIRCKERLNDLLLKTIKKTGQMPEVREETP